MAPSFADGHSKMYKPLNLKSGDHILEVGVGTGISLKNIPEFVKVEAIDYSEPMLVKARKRQENGEFPAEINFQQMDAHVLEFEENQSDLMGNPSDLMENPPDLMETPLDLVENP